MNSVALSVGGCNMLVELLESEIRELMTEYTTYRLDCVAHTGAQPDWVVHRFASTGRSARLIEHADGSATIKQIAEGAPIRSATPLWLQ
jgi:hypothetical protein